MNEITLTDDGRVRNGVVKRRPVAVESVQNAQQSEDLNRGILDGLQVGKFWHQEWNERRCDLRSGSVRPEFRLAAVLKFREGIFAVLARGVKRAGRGGQGADATLAGTSAVGIFLHRSVVDRVLLDPNAGIACGSEISL